MGKYVKLKDVSIRLAVIAFAVFLALAAISNLGLVDIPDQSNLILSLAAILIVFTEIGLVNIIQKKGKGVDFFGAFGLVAGVVLLITLGLELAGIIYAPLEGIRGLIFAVMAGSFLIETFVR